MDPNKIGGDINRPYTSDQTKNKEEIDPEKFKKVLKIDESEGAKKRRKRTLKEAEEEEGDTVREKAPLSPSHAFAEFMDDKDELSNIFDTQSTSTPESPPPAPSPYTPSSPRSISTEGVELEEDLPLSTGESVTSDKPLQSPKKKTPPLSSKKKDASLLASQPKKSELTALKKKKRKKITVKEKSPLKTTGQQAKKRASKKKSLPKTAAPKAKKTAPKEKRLPKIEAPHEARTEEGVEARIEARIEKGKKAPTTKSAGQKKMPAPSKDIPRSASARQESIFHKLSPIQVRKQKKEKVAAAKDQAAPLKGTESTAVRASKEEGQSQTRHERKKHDHDKQFIEATALTAGIPLPTPHEVLPEILPTDAPTYTKLSAQVYELFEKMSGVILIQQNSDKISTTITIDMPNTVLNGVEVVLDKYSTAPMSYNLQLTGSPEALTVLESNLDGLSQAFQEGQYDFEVNILTPTLQTKAKKHLVSRKSNSGGGGQKGKK